MFVNSKDIFKIAQDAIVTNGITTIYTYTSTISTIIITTTPKGVR